VEWIRLFSVLGPWGGRTWPAMLVTTFATVSGANENCLPPRFSSREPRSNRIRNWWVFKC